PHSPPPARLCHARPRTGGAASGSEPSLPYDLPFLAGDRLLIEGPAIVRQDPALQLARAAAPHSDDHIRQPGPGVLPVERGWCGRVVGVRMVHADHVESVPLQLLLGAPERVGIDEVAVARRVGPLVHERHELDGDLAITLERAPDQATGFGRVVRLAVPADRRQMPRIQHERHLRSPARRPCSLKYRSPESGAMTTTTASDGWTIGRADSTRSAATMAAPDDHPTNTPASFARRRTASSASSVATNSVRLGSAGS